MGEIKLTKRYPHSRTEDVVDAFMRGARFGRETIIDHMRDARAENERLRELVERSWKTAERLCQAFDGPCSDDGVTIYKPCPLGERDEECVYGQLQRELRELGVEVDG